MTRRPKGEVAGKIGSGYEPGAAGIYGVQSQDHHAEREPPPPQPRQRAFFGPPPPQPQPQQQQMWRQQFAPQQPQPPPAPPPVPPPAAGRRIARKSNEVAGKIGSVQPPEVGIYGVQDNQPRAAPPQRDAYGRPVQQAPAKPPPEGPREPEPSVLSPERQAWVTALQRELASTHIHMGVLQTREQRIAAELSSLGVGY